MRALAACRAHGPLAAAALRTPQGAGLPDARDRTAGPAANVTPAGPGRSLRPRTTPSTAEPAKMLDDSSLRRITRDVMATLIRNAAAEAALTGEVSRKR